MPANRPVPRSRSTTPWLDQRRGALWLAIFPHAGHHPSATLGPLQPDDVRSNCRPRRDATRSCGRTVLAWSNCSEGPGMSRNSSTMTAGFFSAVAAMDGSFCTRTASQRSLYFPAISAAMSSSGFARGSPRPDSPHREAALLSYHHETSRTCANGRAQFQPPQFIRCVDQDPNAGPRSSQCPSRRARRIQIFR